MRQFTVTGRIFRNWAQVIYVKIRKSYVEGISKLRLWHIVVQTIPSAVNEWKETPRESSDLFYLSSPKNLRGSIGPWVDRLGHRRRLVSLSPVASNLTCVRWHRSVFFPICPSHLSIDATMHTSNQWLALAFLTNGRSRFLATINQ